MQTQGSLQESDLASLLQTMQSERATGTLTLENGDESSALYFLFGHLFHAAGPGGEGEDVVVRALGWRDGSYHFDPRAKLPAEETIKSSPSELIAAAEQAGDQPAAAAAPTLRAIDGQAELEPAFAAAETAEASGSQRSVWGSEPAQAAQSQGEARSASTWSATAQPEAGGWSPSRQAAEPERPAATYAPAEYTPSYTPAAAPTATAAAEDGKPAAPAGAASSAPVGSLPIPAGSPQYEGLKSAFVDFPRLLRTLKGDRHTGYIRLQTGGTSGVLLFREGELIEAEAGENGQEHGEAAFQLFRRDMDTGQGMIDVIDLDADTVTSLARLLTGPPVFTGLLARFVNFGALLEYLQEERLDGSVAVVDGSETGVILLKEGQILAAYSAGSPKPLTNADAVAALAQERAARIEVRGSDSSRGAIDTEAALARPY